MIADPSRPAHDAGGPDYAEAEQLLEKGAEDGALGMRLSELKARTRLVQLYDGHRTEGDGARELANLLGTFTEGHDEADVIAAREAMSS